MATQQKYMRRAPNFSPKIPTKTMLDVARTAAPILSTEDDYDWEAYDYAPGITLEAAQMCLQKISSFQNLFSGTNISNIPADKYAEIASILPKLLEIPDSAESQDEYLGRLGQLAEILGNQDIIHCIDAVKSYNYDQQLAASNGAAATNGNGSQNGSTPPIPPTDILAVDPAMLQPNQPTMIQKLIAPWYSKVILAGVVGGLGYYGYTKFIKKDDDRGDPELDLSQNPFPKVRLNPRKRRKKKVRLKKKKS